MLLLLIGLFVSAILIIVAALIPYINTNNIFGGDDTGLLPEYPEYEDIIHLASNKSAAKKLNPAITINDIQSELKYSQNHPTRPIAHIGQRKLFLNELQFLTNMLKNEDPAIVVYAGASPSNHMYYLHTLFPKVKFLLIDPREFLIYVEGHDKSQYSLPAGIVYLKAGLESHYKIAEKRNIQFYDLADEKIYELNKDTDQDEIKRRNTVYDAHLSDILRYVAESDNKIFIVEDYFTIALAEVFAKRDSSLFPQFYFWSDIRTRIAEDLIQSSDLSEQDRSEFVKLGYDLSFPSNVDTVWNSSQQYNWTAIITPDASMLKYKVPFVFDVDIQALRILAKYEPLASDFKESKKLGIDFVEDYTGDKSRFMYIDGVVYIQPWGPKTTAETRLVTTGAHKIIEWDMVKYEASMFYYAVIQRSFCLHENEYASSELCFDLCGDCALEACIWDEYRKKYNAKFDVLNAVKHLSYITRRNLCIFKHGRLWKPYTREWYNSLNLGETRRRISFGNKN